MFTKARALTASIVLLVGVAASALWLTHGSGGGAALASADQHHAVYLVNGLIVYAKVHGLGSEYPVLTDVYYIRNELKKEPKEMMNHLVKRGQEWHGPDRMVVNAQHILFIEPVAPNSRIAALIKEAK